jgi:hypothetical protein
MVIILYLLVYMKVLKYEDEYIVPGTVILLFVVAGKTSLPAG